MTVDLLLARLRRSVLDLEPDFQRRAGIWNETNQSKPTDLGYLQQYNGLTFGELPP